MPDKKRLAGRPRDPALGPKAEKLVVWRPSSEQVRQAYLALGGSKWLERTVREASNINQMEHLK